MDRSALSDALSGGYIEHYDFDMRRNHVAMRVDVMERGVLSSYDLEFDRVSKFAFETETPTGSIEDRLEITQFYVDQSPEASDSEEWVVSMSMWDTSYLSIRCSTMRVDGELIR